MQNVPKLPMIDEPPFPRKITTWYVVTVGHRTGVFYSWQETYLHAKRELIHLPSIG